MSLESHAEAGERLCSPDIGRELVPLLRCQNKKSCHFVVRPLLALSDGGTSRPAEVVERSTQAGVWGLTKAWR